MYLVAISKAYRIYFRNFPGGFNCIITFFFLFCLWSSPCFPQENSKGGIYLCARKIVDTLSSPSMHGRGYVNGGDSIAAKYIAECFAGLGMKSFEKIDDKHPRDNYYQRFSLPVNTFPGQVKFFLTHPETEARLFTGNPGQNFLVGPDCPGINALFYAFIFDSVDASSEKTMKKFENKLPRANFLIITDDRNVRDPKKIENFKKVKANCFKATGIAELVEKLTWDVSQNVSGFYRVYILADSFNIKTKNLRGSILVQNKFIQKYFSQNLIGYFPGTLHADSFIVFTAHYDHLGVMGKDDKGKEIYFPGANDNASGCAMLLNLAKYYSQHLPEYSIAFMAFGAEEAGLVGSKFYTEHPLFPTGQIKFLINFDIVGTGDEGIKTVNATEFPLQFKTLQVLNAQNSYLKEIQPRGKAAISDHYFFTEKGVKCFYIYTLGGIKSYHDIYDRSETLPLNKFENLFRLVVDFTGWLQAY